ncbi:MAG: hypothetical protein EOP56_19055 [Sphingobacteriales bacterium]|nr:MAG: hypothetical protein EOP56_19055 [Sphingobacteriales bacterium]
MKTPVMLFALAAVLFTTGTSCNRRGCTNPGAINYDAGAHRDDGSCRFEPMGTEPIDYMGSLYVNTADGIKLTELRVNGQDYTGKQFALPSSSVDVCNNPTYQANKISVTAGLNYTIYAKSDLYEWNLNVTVGQNGNVGECKTVALTAANSSTAGKSLAVFTSNTESGMRNITVRVDGDSLGMLMEWSNGAAMRLTKELTPGRHGYTAMSQNGHMWSDSFTVTNGQTTQVLITKATAKPAPAGSANIVFYSSTYKNISVFIDNVYAGRTVNTYPATSANLCSAANAVSVIKKADSSYSYTATSADGQQIWNGTVIANQGAGCILVELN